VKKRFLNQKAGEKMAVKAMGSN